MLLAALFAGCSSDDDGVAETTNGTEEQQATRTENETAFLKTFVGNYWQGEEYGLVMNDGSSVVEVNPEKKIFDLRVQGGTMFPVIQVLNDSVVRQYFDVILVSSELDGQWYTDTPYSFDGSTDRLTFSSEGALVPDEMTLETLGDDRIRFVCEPRFNLREEYPDTKCAYFVYRKLTDKEGAALTKDYLPRQR